MSTVLLIIAALVFGFLTATFGVEADKETNVLRARIGLGIMFICIVLTIACGYAAGQ